MGLSDAIDTLVVGGVTIPRRRINDPLLYLDRPAPSSVFFFSLKTVVLNASNSHMWFSYVEIVN
jgi:hypothetical protein